MSNNIYTIKKGEKIPIYIKVKNRDEDMPIDLTNAQIRFTLKDELKDTFNVIEKIITTETDAYSVGRILDPKLGEFIIRFTDDDYENLVCERLYYATIIWEKPDEDFSKVISSNCNDYLLFKICYP
jgi:hypothetical protein